MKYLLIYKSIKFFDFPNSLSVKSKQYLFWGNIAGFVLKFMEYG